MSTIAFSFLIILAILMGLIIGHAISKWRYATRLEELKKKTEDQMADLNRKLCADVEAHGNRILERLAELAEQYGPDHPIPSVRAMFEKELEEGLRLAADSPILSSTIANNMFPPVLVAIGQAIGSEHATKMAAKKHQETNATAIDLLIQMSAGYWQVIRASRPNIPEQEAQIIQVMLEETYTSLSQIGISPGLPKLAEALNEMNRLAEQYPPSGGQAHNPTVH